MKNIGIRFAGFGGQGLIFASIVLARAASMYESRFASQRDDELLKREENIYAVQTQTYGPESRGGASKAEVKISQEEILFPQVEVPDVLVIMSQPAFEKYGEEVREDTIILIDPATVASRPKQKYYEIAATETATLLGKKIVANMVMVGAVCAITKVVSLEAVRKAILDQAPKGSEELNIKALEKGYELGRKVLR